MDFGELLLRIQARSGLSERHVQTLMDAVGVERSSFSRYKSGELAPPGREKVVQMAFAFGLKASEANRLLQAAGHQQGLSKTEKQQLREIREAVDPNAPESLVNIAIEAIEHYGSKLSKSVKGIERKLEDSSESLHNRLMAMDDAIASLGTKIDDLRVPHSTAEDTVRSSARAPSEPDDTSGRSAEEHRGPLDQALSEAEELQLQYKYQEALDCLLSAYKRELPAAARAELHVYIGNAYLHLGTVSEAKKRYDMALKLARESRREDLEADALGNLGQIAESQGDFAGAHKLHDAALKLDERRGNQKGQADELNSLGIIERRSGNPGGAIDLFDRARTIHRDLGNAAGEAITTANIANVLRDRGDDEEALKLYSRALAIYRAIEHRKGEAQTLGDIGTLEGLYGDGVSEMNHYESALKIYEAIDDELGQAQIRTRLGSAYMQQGHYDTAEACFQQALSVHRKLGDRLEEAKALAGLAAIADARGDRRRAKYLLEDAARLHKEMGLRGSGAELLNRALESLEDRTPE